MTELDHPCRDTCSGWKQGYERGAQDLTVAYMSGFEAAKGAYEAREAVLVEALRFYADPVNWEFITSGHGYSSQIKIKDDGGWDEPAGVRARETLKQLGAEE